MVNERRNFNELINGRQHNRTLCLSFPNGDGPRSMLLPDRLQAKEELSRDFEFKVKLLAEDASAVFWPLFILSIIVGIALALVSASTLQEWISRCYFSTSVSLVRAATHGKPPFKLYPYSTAEAEFKAYQNVIGA